MLRLTALLCAALASPSVSVTPYEERYGARFQRLPADEIVAEPLEKLAFGSCQKLENDPSVIYASIMRYKPDMFLFTGDIIYANNGCCEPHCVKSQYDRLKSSPVYQKFVNEIKRVDGIYDDHDFGRRNLPSISSCVGVNDGHATYDYRDYSQRYLLDFFDKPADHYRRKRAGAYFSVLFSDPAQPKRTVKLIVLDVRYHRDCYYYCRCDKCLWKPMVFNKMAAFRLLNYFLGFGCNHKGDTLGAEQWRWLEGQLHDSEAEAHIIVSSIQIFTGYPLSESWGLLPEAKDRLVELLLATQPKNPIFVSGDVHYGELLQKDVSFRASDIDSALQGVVEVTSSSLTHSFMMQKKSLLRPFAISLFVFKCDLYLFNNFGAIEFRYDQNRDALKWDAKILSTEGLVMRHYTNDTARDPRAMYRDLRGKSKSFFKDTRLVKCRGLLWRDELVRRLLQHNDGEGTLITPARSTGLGRQLMKEASTENDEEPKQPVKDVDSQPSTGEASGSPGGVSLRDSPVESDKSDNANESAADTPVLTASSSSELGKLSMEERLAMRAKRFNVTTTTAGAGKTKSKTTSSSKRGGRGRGERAPLTPEERMKRRLERLMKRDGVQPGVPLDDEERARRKKRLERFGAQ
ncbi:alkaline phosphatase, putative [Babesia caballi]|uniref:Alkaline phosphatase, putative n=1 Tax=Babesia caballi TaxID=5871 RepID=A0AAV4LWL9_BABCB|nr:alkaline phosphatase, putative [Babesia caballi]